MKTIYRFKLDKQVEVEETQITKDNEGKEIKILVKVNRPESHSYLVREPNRSILEEQELFTASVIAECDKRGIFRRVSLQKKYLDQGDILSADQRKAYEKAKDDLFSKQLEYQELNEKKDKTEEETKKFENITNELYNILSEIQKFESQLDDELYQHTAENIARNRTALWLSIMLAYEEKDGKFIPVFGNGTYEDKLGQYDNMRESGDEFFLTLTEKFNFSTSLWYFGKAQTQEDIDLYVKMYEKKDLIEATETLSKADNKEEKVE